MAKTIEYNNQGTWYGRLYDEINNRLARDPLDLHTWAWAWDATGRWNPPRQSNLYNGFAMIRIIWWWPGIYFHLRFKKNRRTQFGVGWKINGRLGATFRPWQSNANAAAGYHDDAPNLGHAEGWERGTA